MLVTLGISLKHSMKICVGQWKSAEHVDLLAGKSATRLLVLQFTLSVWLSLLPRMSMGTEKAMTRSVLNVTMMVASSLGLAQNAGMARKLTNHQR